MISGDHPLQFCGSVSNDYSCKEYMENCTMVTSDCNFCVCGAWIFFTKCEAPVEFPFYKSRSLKKKKK